MGRRAWTRCRQAVNTVRQYLHGSLHTILKHLIPLHPVTAPSSLSKAKYPDPLNQPLACWLSSTADVQGGVALGGCLHPASHRTDDESGLDREYFGINTDVYSSLYMSDSFLFFV